MEAIIFTMVISAWLLILMGWLEFLGDIFISIIEKEFNLRDTLIVFGFLVILSVYSFWLGIQLLS